MDISKVGNYTICGMKHFLLRFCSFELTRVSTYRNISNEFRSERSCFAFSLPKSEARTRKWASRTASLARDTIRKRRKRHTLQHTCLSTGIFPKLPTALNSPFPIGPKGKKKSQTHSSLCKNRFPWSAHQNLKSKLISLPKKPALSTTLFLLLGTE